MSNKCGVKLSKKIIAYAAKLYYKTNKSAEGNKT